MTLIIKHNVMFRGLIDIPRDHLFFRYRVTFCVGINFLTLLLLTDFLTTLYNQNQHLNLTHPQW